jgi:Aspartyl protease
LAKDEAAGWVKRENNYTVYKDGSRLQRGSNGLREDVLRREKMATEAPKPALAKGKEVPPHLATQGKTARDPFDAFVIQIDEEVGLDASSYALEATEEGENEAMFEALMVAGFTQEEAQRAMLVAELTKTKAKVRDARESSGPYASQKDRRSPRVKWADQSAQEPAPKTLKVAPVPTNAGRKAMELDEETRPSEGAGRSVKTPTYRYTSGVEDLVDVDALLAKFMKMPVPPTITMGELLGSSPALKRGLVEMIKTKRVPVGETKKVADVPRDVVVSAPVVLREPSYSSPLPRVKVTVNGVSTVALIDTGSEINIATAAFQERANIPVNEDFTISTRGMHGQAGKSMGCCESLVIRFGNISTLGHYHVFPTAPFDILCGQPFLKNHLSLLTEDGENSKMTLKDFFDETKKVTIIIRSEANGMRSDGNMRSFPVEALNFPLTAREYEAVVRGEGSIEEIQGEPEPEDFGRPLEWWA